MRIARKDAMRCSAPTQVHSQFNAAGVAGTNDSVAEEILDHVHHALDLFVGQLGIDRQAEA
ncbi:MAG TPA: hypothetical protein PKH32_11905, partial [Verrucomicrobiota bacterium]|nr:hypothetical protein [Verrucomicrobiota bacterium]